MASDDEHRSPGFRPPAASAGAESPPAEEDDAQSRDVHRRVVLEAPPAEVWRALTDPDELAAWWGEGTELDAVADGEGRIVEDDEPVRLVRVVEAKPGRRLVFDWWPEDPEVDEPASRVTIELVPCPFGTVLTVTECVLLDLTELPVLVLPRPTFLPAPWGPSWGMRALARV